MKPIHKDMSGIIHIIIFIWLAAGPCLLCPDIDAMLIKKLSAAETTGISTTPMLLHVNVNALITLLGKTDKSIPKKL